MIKVELTLSPFKKTNEPCGFLRLFLQNFFFYFGKEFICKTIHLGSFSGDWDQVDGGPTFASSGGASKVTFWTPVLQNRIFVKSKKKKNHKPYPVTTSEMREPLETKIMCWFGSNDIPTIL